MRFQVGDVVRGTQKGDEVYSITNSNMIKGVVIGVRVRYGIEYFDIKVKAHAIQSFVGRCYYHLCSDCFELCADFDASVVDAELEKLLFAQS